MNYLTSPGDYVVQRGDYVNDEWICDARAAFMAGYGEDTPSMAGAEAAWALWLAEGRTQPGGPLIYAPGAGDRIVPRGHGVA